MQSRAKVEFVVTRNPVVEKSVVVEEERELIRGELFTAETGMLKIAGKDDKRPLIVVGRIPVREDVLRLPAVYEATKALASDTMEVSVLAHPFPTGK